MSFGDVLLTIFEFGLVVFTIWAMLNEDRFIAFEQKIISAIRRRRLRVVKSVRTDKSFS